MYCPPCLVGAGAKSLWNKRWNFHKIKMKTGQLWDNSCWQNIFLKTEVSDLTQPHGLCCEDRLLYLSSYAWPGLPMKLYIPSFCHDSRLYVFTKVAEMIIFRFPLFVALKLSLVLLNFLQRSFSFDQDKINYVRGSSPALFQSQLTMLSLIPVTNSRAG